MDTCSRKDRGSFRAGLKETSLFQATGLQRDDEADGLNLCIKLANFPLCKCGLHICCHNKVRKRRKHSIQYSLGDGGRGSCVGLPGGVLVYLIVSGLCSLPHTVCNIIQTLSHMDRGRVTSQSWFYASF